MTDLVVPDPKRELVPTGWWDGVARPAIEDAATMGALDETEAKLRAFVSLIEGMSGGDAVEFEKALRVVAKRRAELLGPAVEGRPSGNLPRVASFAAPSTISRWRKIAEHWDDLIYPHLQRATKREQVTEAQCLRLVREHTPAEPDADLPDTVDTEGRVSLLHGDFRERLLELDAGSVDLIVTDPPYPKEDLPLYSDLAQVAAKILAPRGILFVWTGQIFLPEVIERLSDHLTYGWTFALQLPGSGSRIFGRHIVQAWKPVLAFSTGTWPSGEWGDDWLISPAREKTEYEWQQHGAPAQRVIERYSAPDGLVVDPFLGVGSFGAAALAAGRRFVGVELDAGRFATARERLQ